MAESSKREANLQNWKPGSEPEKAAEVGSDKDFGVPAGDGPSRQRDYVSTNTRSADPGATQPFSWEHDGVRDHGAGGRDSGPGSASGGDLDPDLLGFGTEGGGVSQSGPGDAAPGPDDSDGTSNEFASPLPNNPRSAAIIEPGGKTRPDQAAEIVHGRTIGLPPERESAPTGEGADAATNPFRGDDSFAGEISSGEAAGQDNEIDRSSEADTENE